MGKRITNRHRLPPAIVRAIEAQAHDRCGAWRTITELLGPPRKVVLEDRHADELEEDAADNLWSLLGSAMHEILRRADVDALTEERLFMPVDGKVISGAFDRLSLDHDRTITDYKVTSVYTVKNGGRVEWEEQTNLYAHLAEYNGHTADGLEVCAILRDWRPSEAKRQRDYPPLPLVVVPLPVWTPAQRDAFLRERVALHLAAEHALPFCTDEERWLRRGVPLRCEAYCAVAKQCRAIGDGQWKE